MVVTRSQWQFAIKQLPFSAKTTMQITIMKHNSKNIKGMQNLHILILI